MQARRSVAQPQAQIRGSGSEQQIQSVTLNAAQEVAAQPEVTFEVADARFDRGAAAEALAGFSPCIGAGGGLWFGGDE